VLNVSRSGYKDWSGRPPSIREQQNNDLLKKIKDIHETSRKSYGSPRVHAELTIGQGTPVSRKRVERLMRDAGIQGAYRRKGRRNLVNLATQEDLVGRAFVADAPDRLWVSDITEHPTGEGKVYCAAVMDVYSRRIIGHSIDLRQGAQLVVDAMIMAVVRRDPRDDETILHSDHGTQYTAIAYGKRLRESGLLGSMGTVGDCYDNAMMESFWGSMQIELLDTCKWQTRRDLASAMFEWIECWYNPYRRHSSLEMLSPIAYEELYRATNASS
jgi:putative transposase